MQFDLAAAEKALERAVVVVGNYIGVGQQRAFDSRLSLNFIVTQCCYSENLLMGHGD